jgi:hypothetical protein
MQTEVSSIGPYVCGAHDSGQYVQSNHPVSSAVSRFAASFVKES